MKKFNCFKNIKRPLCGTAQSRVSQRAVSPQFEVRAQPESIAHRKTNKFLQKDPEIKHAKVGCRYYFPCLIENETHFHFS